LVLDLALLSDWAHRSGLGGIQQWLSFFYKSPTTPVGVGPEHDLFVQLKTLHETVLRVSNPSSR
jgi:myo-inositol-1-phosphate synthase